MAGGLITDYLAQGTAASRPAAPSAASGTLSLYFASDTEVLSIYDWNDAAWQDVTVGYATGSGGTVTQATSRTTGVTLNKRCGTITLVSAPGSTTAASFTVTNSEVAATDEISICQKSGTDKYIVMVTAVGAGSFEVTFRTFSGTTTEQPVFKFAVIKAVES